MVETGSVGGSETVANCLAWEEVYEEVYEDHCGWDRDMREVRKSEACLIGAIVGQCQYSSRAQWRKLTRAPKGLMRKGS